MKAIVQETYGSTEVLQLRDIHTLEPGDEVIGIGKGTYAQYARAAENKLAPKPAGPHLQPGRRGRHLRLDPTAGTFSRASTC
jgi:hypothetical protein